MSYSDTSVEVAATNKGSEGEIRVDAISRINEGPSFELASQNMLIASDDDVDPHLKTKFMEWFSNDCNEQFRVGDVLQNGNFFQ